KSCTNALVENPKKAQRKKKSVVSHATAAENPPPAPQSGRKKPRRNPVRMTQTEPALQSANDHGSQIHKERNLMSTEKMVHLVRGGSSSRGGSNGSANRSGSGSGYGSGRGQRGRVQRGRGQRGMGHTTGTQESAAN
ncbi:fragile X mental retardation protein 1 homolog, partial [Striga asiatica]